MEAHFPQHLASLLNDRLKAQGVQLVPNANVVGVVEGPGGSCRVVLEDGSHKDSDVVVLALGVAPDYELLARSGLEVDETRGGVVANSELQIRR